MSARLHGKVALITGAARGIGRACAVRFAQEGADLALLDLGGAVETVDYDGAREEQLTQTAREVRDLGRRALTFKVDVRDGAALDGAVARTIEQLGQIDVAVAAAGVESFHEVCELTGEQWDAVLDVNLKGVWWTVKALAPHMRSRRTGSIVLVGSTNSHKPTYGYGHYTASKHGVLGLARALALELGPDMVRVNVVAPTATATDMLLPQLGLLAGREGAGAEEGLAKLREAHALPVAMLEPVDVANAALFLASEEARYVTGISLPVDLGALVK
ncbi:MAG TPA: mycofactocin-coupled SDR family oxidoreductase [Solirubrobacteraceae bacterium]|jgi:SDR family mycofactocin-dependent oxidoreductase